jgi:hypothetical protein
MALILCCALVSLIGVVGLATCPPRPRAQETWAIVTLAPIFMLVFVSLFRLGGL